MATTTTDQASVRIGALKQIGENGPAYEILKDATADNDCVRIRLIETGEELEYPRDQVLSDQDAT